MKFFRKTKFKSALITLLLISFCVPQTQAEIPQTQAEICEEYWYVFDYELAKLIKNRDDLSNSFKLFNKDKLPEDVLYANIKEEIDNLDDYIEVISDLTPDESNELNHIKILRGLEDAKEGLEDMQSYFEEGFGKDSQDRARAAANYAVSLTEIVFIGIAWDCPTD